MVKLEIVEYIEKELSKGLHISAIKKSLIEVGHDISSIEEAILHVQKKRKYYPHLVKYIIPVALMVVLLLFAVFLREKEPGVAQGLKEGVTEKLVGGTGEFEEESDRELLDRAILNRDPEICNEITDSDLRTICTQTLTPASEETPEEAETIGATDESLIDQAVLSRNASICMQIQDTTLQNQCLLIVG